MESLPSETEYNILYRVSRPKDIFNICRSSKRHYDICSTDYFWENKFREENLPILEQGHDFSSWLKIYDKTYRSDKFAFEAVNSGRNIIVDTGKIPDFYLIYPIPENIKFKSFYEEFYKEIFIPIKIAAQQRSLDEPSPEDEYTIAAALLEFMPEDDKFIVKRVQQIEKIKFGILQNVTYDSKGSPYFPPLTKEEVFELLFRLFYEGYGKDIEIA